MGRRGFDTDDLQGSFESRVAAINAACKSVAQDVRGLPQEEAEQRLTDALRQRNLFSPQSELRLLAYQMTDPWRSLKHPFRTHREVRRMFNEPDPAHERALAQSDDVSERISQILDALDPDVLASWEFSSESTFDGPRYQLVLHPCSDHLATQIRDALAPIRITILAGHDS